MDSFYSDLELQKIGFRHIGNNVKISRKASIYMPDTITVANNVRIDDFCCLVGGTNGISIGSYVHIAFFCVLVGEGGIRLEDFSGLSSRVSLYSASDDYLGTSLTNPTVPNEYRKISRGEIVLGKHVIIGSGSTVLPNVNIEIGCSIGANSLVTKNLQSWGVYAGSPVKKIKNRDKSILDMEKELILKYGI